MDRREEKGRGGEHRRRRGLRDGTEENRVRRGREKRDGNPPVSTAALVETIKRFVPSEPEPFSFLITFLLVSSLSSLGETLGLSSSRINQRGEIETTVWTAHSPC